MSKHKSQLNPVFAGTVIRVAGTQQLEVTQAGELVVVKNGMLTDWVVLYDRTGWAVAGVFTLNREIRDALDYIDERRFYYTGVIKNFNTYHGTLALCWDAHHTLATHLAIRDAIFRYSGD